MHVVLVNRQTKEKRIIHNCESIALIDANNEPHAPQYQVPNARQQLSAQAFIINRVREQPETFGTAEWQLTKD
ncbi:hypothetical protein [Furfurilactobacillus siliginis]|nr:hypothetical protein [Furfurilactobacillus siliginis]GEK28831.1 hypothetical protein LSI01_11420 [Furfurilactobacillus siliginis]